MVRPGLIAGRRSDGGAGKGQKWNIHDYANLLVSAADLRRPMAAARRVLVAGSHAETVFCNTISTGRVGDDSSVMTSGGTMVSTWRGRPGIARWRV